MNYVYTAVLFLKYYPILSAFIAGLIGEELIIFLAFLSGQGIISFWIVLVYGLLAIICVDSFLFFLGRWKMLHKIAINKTRYFKYNNFMESIKKITHNNVIVSLFLTKFVYGPRMLIIIYFGYQNMKYKKFFIKDTIALFLWAAIMVPLAWVAGLGLVESFSVVKNIERVVAIAIVFIVAIYFTARYLISETARKYK